MEFLEAEHCPEWFLPDKAGARGIVRQVREKATRINVEGEQPPQHRAQDREMTMALGVIRKVFNPE